MHADVVAPRWHTAILVLSIVGVNAIGLIFFRGHDVLVRSGSSGSKILTAYLPAIAAEWMLFAWAAFAFRPRHVLSHLMGRQWTAHRRWPIDLAWSLAIISLIVGFELILARFLTLPQNPAVVALLPRTIGERVAWVLVATSAGFCEEVVYRGYLRIELGVLMRSAPLGIALQALLFGIAHAEQGVLVAFRFALYGLALGALAARRESLVPCIIAHVTIDLCAGLVPHG
ncbi:MAG: CPBP family intramembrane glutamic endopeptidase [Polyangiaceae bacterium]